MAPLTPFVPASGGRIMIATVTMAVLHTLVINRALSSQSSELPAASPSGIATYAPGNFGLIGKTGATSTGGILILAGGVRGKNRQCLRRDGGRNMAITAPEMERPGMCNRCSRRAGRCRQRQLPACAGKQGTGNRMYADHRG